MQATSQAFPPITRDEISSPSLAAVPAIAARGVVVDAVSLAVAVLGRSSVSLPGFDPRDAQVRPWTHPSAAFIPAPSSPMDAIKAITDERRRFRWIAALMLLLVSVVIFSAGVVFAALKFPSATFGEGQLSWTVIDVQPNALVIATSSGRIAVPVGGRLPNGDGLLSVLHERRTVVLTSGTLVLPGAHKQVRP